MKASIFNKKIHTVHFVGIGGIGISGLAQHLLKLGCVVSGSDRTKTALTENLIKQGITVHYTHDSRNIPKDCNLVVYSSAVPTTNVELVEAKRRNIPILVREQLLGIIFDGFTRRVAVSGVHGKTTVTAMLDFVLRGLQQSHTAFVGGVLENSHSNYCQGDDLVIAEACEFRQSFRYLHPDIAVVLNIELDHPDCYQDTDSMYCAFGAFLGNLSNNGTVVVNGDQVDSSLYISHSYITFGLAEHNYIRAINLAQGSGKYSFDLVIGDSVIGTVKLNVCGKHNVYNALATLSVLLRLGFDINKCIELLYNFEGAERRWERRKCKSFYVIEDYAHHPTEIKASIATAHEVSSGKVWLFFQPHTYTRTKALWQNFVECFDGVNFVGLLDIYSAREQCIANIDSQHLAQDINARHRTTCQYFENIESAKQFILDNVDNNDLVLIVGAGDIYKLSELLEKY